MDRLEFLKTKVKDFDNKTITIDDKGMNNIIIILDNILYRFPKYKNGIDSMIKEVNVLNLLNSKKIYKEINIPNAISYNFDKENIIKNYICYQIIEGEPLIKSRFDVSKDKDHIASDLAIYLKNIHNQKVDDFLKAGVLKINPINVFEKMFYEIQNKLFIYMRDDAKKKIEIEFKTFIDKCGKNNFEYKLLHGDFGPTNILYKDGEISGVIDFGEVNISDPAYDFASLMGPFGYGEDFVRNILINYRENIETEEYISRAKFYIKTFALQDALFGYNNKSKADFDFGMKNFI